MRKLLIPLLLVAILLSACAGQATTQAPAPTEPPAATEAPLPTEAPKPTEAPTAAPTEAPTAEPVQPVELRFTYYADGTEADCIKPLLDQFMVANPEIKVVLDVVPYKTIDEQLPVQVESGQG